jgi:hypothetical protein
MSENIGKHVFELYGSRASFRGTIERETPSTWGMKGGRRKFKDPREVLIDGSIDPKAADEAFRKAFAEHDAEIADARETLWRLEREQREAAIAAMKALKQ